MQHHTEPNQTKHLVDPRDNYTTGRPVKFQTVKELEAAINKYFSQCNPIDNPPTFTGLARNIGVDRKTLLNYSKRDEFFPVISEARLYLEDFIEQKLILEGKAGQIFYAKNNMGYVDKHEVSQTVNNITINVADDDVAMRLADRVAQQRHAIENDSHVNKVIDVTPEVESED